MIIGYSFFTGQCFDSNIPSDEIYRIELENSKIDEIKIDKNNLVTYNIEKQNWGLDTILHCSFKDLNFEGGNVTLAGMPIECLRIKKRKVNELSWKKYKDISFDSSKTTYNWSDYFVESLTDYEYAIMPVGSQNVEGQYSINTISCEYEDIYILGTNNEQYHLVANLNMGDIITVSPSTFVEVLGSKYPYEISNGSINYKKGNCKATLISNNTLNSNNQIDRIAEKILRNNLYKFLTNNKPKIFKESEGNYLLVSIPSNSVKLSPINDSSRQIADISFDLYEIDDVEDIISLQNSGLLL